MFLNFLSIVYATDVIFQAYCATSFEKIVKKIKTRRWKNSKLLA